MKADNPQLSTRPLPSLDQWLSDNGDGTRGDGFQALEDLLERLLAKGEPARLSENDRTFYRMLIGMQIAVVELSNIEIQRGREPWQIVQIMPRVLGAVAVYSAASVLADDAPYRQLLTVLVEEFRHGAKISADTLAADQEKQREAGEVPFR